MKIAIVSTFYPYRGGIAQFNASLYRAFEKLGHEVEAYNFSLQYPSFLFPGKTQMVTQKDSADVIPSKRLINSIQPVTYLKTAKKVKEFQPDLVIIGYWMPFMAPSLGTIAQQLSKSSKVVSIVHNAIPHERSIMDKLLSRYFFKRNSKIVALSNAVASDIHREFPKLSTIVLHHPVYHHFGKRKPKDVARKKLDIPQDKKVLLFFGLVRAYKGLDILLKALPILDDSYEVIIAGETYGSFEEYDRIIQENNLAHRVHHFDRYINDNEVVDFFSAADACVLPYKSATQSGVVAIAQSFGVPVFVSNVGGLHEFIEHQRTGFLIEELTGTGFAREIESAFKTEKLTEVFKTLSEESEQQNSWEEFAEEVIRFSNGRNE